MMKFPTIEELAQNVAEKALDEIEYNGKTLREWMEIMIETASEDTISRRAAIEVIPKKQNGTGGESWMKTYRRSGHNDCVDACVTALQELPPVTYTKINPLPDYARQFGLIPKEDATKHGTNLAEVGTDCISREQAIDALVAKTIYTEEELKEYYEEHSHKSRWENGIYDAVKTIKQLPPIQPIQPKRGKWIRDGHHMRCDQCGMYICDTDREGDRIPTEFCSNCGAVMRGEQNG